MSFVTDRRRVYYTKCGMSFKEDILHYLHHGVFAPEETKEIAVYIGCSERYVQKIVKEFNQSKPHNQLTVETYIKAILSGSNTKKKIADFLSINRRSLLRFENKNISAKKISRYLYIAGIDLQTICHLYRLSEEETAALQELPTIAGVKSDLKTISAILHPFKTSCEDIDSKHANVNKILWML